VDCRQSDGDQKIKDQTFALDGVPAIRERRNTAPSDMPLFARPAGQDGGPAASRGSCRLPQTLWTRLAGFWRLPVHSRRNYVELGLAPPPQPAAASILARSSTPFAPQPCAPGGTSGRNRS
jgi:hypothetical protein